MLVKKHSSPELHAALRALELGLSGKAFVSDVPRKGPLVRVDPVAI